MSFPRVLASLVVASLFAVLAGEGWSQSDVPDPNAPPAPGLPQNQPAPGGDTPAPPQPADVPSPAPAGNLDLDVPAPNPGTAVPGTTAPGTATPGAAAPVTPAPGTTRPPGTVRPGGIPGGPGSAAAPAAPTVPPGFRDAPNRYYYDRWAYNEASKYFYLKLHYHENPGDRAYKYHYVLAFPSQPQYAYFYDPGKKAFWGRYEYGSKPEACFCKLEPKLVGGNVTAAPAEAIGPPQPFGKVPGAVAATANIIAPPPHPGDLPVN